MALLEVKNLKKIYTTRLGGNKVQALDNVNFSVEQGEYVAIMGESGSGKTTLLNIMASLDKPTKGAVILAGKNMADIKQKELCAFRRDNLGFVFQDFNLLDSLSLKDNIFLPMVLAGWEYGKMEERLKPLAKKLGIAELLEKYPYEVSGGQKQRTAVARALITEPQIVLADEPTGALDSKASDRLLRIFAEVNEDGQTIVMVTHSIQAASRAGRVLFIKDGCVFNQIYRGNLSDEEMYRKISDTLTVLQTEKTDLGPGHDGIGDKDDRRADRSREAEKEGRKASRDENERRADREMDCNRNAGRADREMDCNGNAGKTGSSVGRNVHQGKEEA